MRRLLAVLLLPLPLVSVARAGAAALFDGAGVTMQNDAAANDNGTPVQIAGLLKLTYSVVGTFTATVNFEGSADGANYQSLDCVPITGAGRLVASTNVAGTWRCNVAGLSWARARVSGYASGSVTVSALATVDSIGTPILSSPAAASLPSPGAAATPAQITGGALSGAMVRPDVSQWSCDAQKYMRVTVVTCPPFNAKGDGSTIDSTAIQSAWDQGGVVIMPAGTYRSNTKLNYPTRVPLIVIGAGVGNTLIQCTQGGGTDCVNISGAGNNIYHQLMNLQIRCSGTNLSGGNGLSIDASANGIPVTVRNVYVSGCRTVGKAAVNLSHVFNSLFDNLVTTDSYYGVHLTLSNANHFISNTHAQNVYGIYVESDSNSNIFAGGEIANGPTLIYVNGFFNEFDVYIENGGMAQQGVSNAFGPTVHFDNASYSNRLGTKASHDEKIQDKGIGNLVVPAGGPFHSNLAGLQLATPLCTTRPTVTNAFFDSSFNNAPNFVNTGGGLSVTQDRATGFYDSTSVKFAYGGAAASNGRASGSDQTFSGSANDIWSTTFWVKASRDMVDAESGRMYWFNISNSAVLTQAFIKGLKGGVWTPVTLSTFPLTGNQVLRIGFQFNAPSGAFAAIAFNVDDVHVERFPAGANGTATGPAGYTYVLNTATAAARTLNSHSAYCVKLLVDSLTATLNSSVVNGPLFFNNQNIGNPRITTASNMLDFGAGTGGFRWSNHSGSTSLMTLSNTGFVGFNGSAFANLGVAANGTMIYCTDCDPATNARCSSSGAKTGAFAFRVNGAWKCLG